MANPVPGGSDVSAGTYRCTNCGNRSTLARRSTYRPVPPAATVCTRPSPEEIAPTTPIQTGKAFDQG